jgi:hypothetical protein
MQLESKDLVGKNGMIKKDYTADGADISPELVWSDVPEGTQSFALYVHDPDAPDPKAPRIDWIHWMIVNIPVDTLEIPKGGPAPGVEVVNDFGRESWGGPSPPIGVHRYFFKVFALNVPNLEDVTKDNFLEKVEEAKLDEAEIMAKYGRK